jgi:hypothetical protein
MIFRRNRKFPLPLLSVKKRDATTRTAGGNCEPSRKYERPYNTWSYVNIRFVCVLRRRRFTTSYVITIMLLFVQLTNVSARLCSIDVIPTKK